MPRQGEPFFWGPGRDFEGLKAEMARPVIDGSAYTHATRWDVDPDSLDWVRFDVTSAPYPLRKEGAAANIIDYWILNLVQRQLEVYRDPVADSTQPFGFRYANRTILDPVDVVSPQASIAVVDLLPR